MSSMSSRGVLWEVVRPVLAWPLRSPLRLGLVVAALVVALVVVAQVGGRGQGDPDQLAGATASPTVQEQPGEDLAGSTSHATVSSQGGDLAEEEPEVGHDHGHSHDEALESSVPLDEADPSVLTQEPQTDVQQDAVAAGVAAVQAMTRPGEDDDVDEQQWWEDFAATLTAQAQDDYEGIDPQTVPWTEASSEGVLVPMGEGHEHLVQFVQVDTDRGPVVAHVSRDGQDGWAVARIEWEWEER